MLVVFISKTGKIRQFLQKTGYENILEIKTGQEIAGQDFILLVGTVGFGEIAPEVVDFLKQNHGNMKAIIGSGNKNWGSCYCGAAYKISEKTGVPILMTFESAGTTHDVEKFLQVVRGK